MTLMFAAISHASIADTMVVPFPIGSSSQLITSFPEARMALTLRKTKSQYAKRAIQLQAE